MPAASAFAHNSNVEREFGESPRREVARGLREVIRAIDGDIAVRGHSFQIGSDATFWTPKAQDGTNVFRTRYFGRWAVALLPKADSFVLLSTAALTNDKLRRVTSPTRRRLSHLSARAGHAQLGRSHNARASIVCSAVSQLPDRYGRKVG